MNLDRDPEDVWELQNQRPKPALELALNIMAQFPRRRLLGKNPVKANQGCDNLTLTVK
jgi:hypothetical protein